MPFKASFPERWRFQASVLAPVVFSLLVTAATVSTFLLWSTADLDDRTLRHEYELAEHILAEKLAALPHDQLSVANWDDAFERTALQFDPDWVHKNIGRWMHAYFGHDRTFVLDEADQPIYAMNNGHRVDVVQYRADEATLRPLVLRLRTRLREGELVAYAGGAGNAFPNVTGITRLGGLPVIVSVSPLAGESGRLTRAYGEEFLLVSVNDLDAAFAKDLARDYLLEDASFSRLPSFSTHRAQYPILDMDGRISGFLEWTPNRPGATMLTRTGLALAGGFVFPRYSSSCCSTGFGARPQRLSRDASRPSIRPITTFSQASRIVPASTRCSVAP